MPPVVPHRDFPATALAAELRSSVTGEVRFDAASRALYATDASNYRQVPVGVVVPADVDDVVATVEACRRHGAPVLARGGGTSLAGQCCNVAVVMDFSKLMHRVLEVDPVARRARVEPGTVLDVLRAAAAPHGLTFGPDPATHSRCTLGGMIGNNSCGVHSVMAGKTVDNVEGLEILTYDGQRLSVGKTSDDELAGIVSAGGRRGEIYARLKALVDRHAALIRERFPKIPRRVSGYNLDALLPENGFDLARALVGSEGTCVTLLGATLRLVESPPGRALLVLGYPDVASAADHVPEVLSHHPIGLEGLDQRLLEAMRAKRLHDEDLRLLPPGGGWLLVELGGGDAAAAAAQARALASALSRTALPPQVRLYEDRARQQRIWELRESGLGATAYAPGRRRSWPGWEDSAVSPERIGPYLRDLRRLLDRFGYEGAFYGHFGDGCVHVHVDFDLETAAGVESYLSFLDQAADLVIGYGGSLSGEHGDGQARAALLPKMFGPELVAAFREFKSIWDPDGKMNPGKLVDPWGPAEHLRLGAGYSPWRPATSFRFPDDPDGFAGATLRCVGVGKCRRLEGGVMCPSYKVTREERDSTRGRARLLFELLERDVVGREGWHDPAVKEALDLCLACKGCKSDCPVRVDMATYKAEFLSHYWAGRLRPPSAYAFGLVRWWTAAGALAPGLTNFLSGAPGLSTATKALSGVAWQRRLPRLARVPFRRAWRRRARRAAGDRRRVLLFPDTFNDRFHPEVSWAAVEVLERAGFAVALPERSLCCGRPLYDYGFLGLARRELRRVLDCLAPELASGVPVVVLEPSCAAVFRDELPGLFPDDGLARRLADATVLLADLLEREAKDLPLPDLGRPALLHGHCHQKALFGMAAEERLLTRLGVVHEVPEPGCCGMAGAFGFERGEHHRVSVACAEAALLPAVRAAPSGTLLLADGFSCREQIFQGTGRRPLHLAELLRDALAGGPAQRA